MVDRSELDDRQMSLVSQYLQRLQAGSVVDLLLDDGQGHILERIA